MLRLPYSIGFDSVETAVLEGQPVHTQFRLLHGGGAYGAVRADGAFASAAALSSAVAFVRKLPTFGEADAAAIIVPKAHVYYPLVWYALNWPDQLGIDAKGVFVELHARGAATATFFMVRPAAKQAAVGIAHLTRMRTQPEVGGVLSEAVLLASDCALIEAPLFEC